MTVQDDQRERELTLLFNLAFDYERERSGTDAHLELDGRSIPFELKSTTTGTVSTARDVGMEHLEKWSRKHWLFGFYSKGARRLQYCHYASPRMMKSWIDEKRSYIKPDYDLAHRDRLEYVCRRGSTINNPHIPKSYFKGWKRIDRDHADTLRRMVRQKPAGS